MGITAIVARLLGHALVSLAAFVLLVPFLLWPPWWPLIRTAFDAARHNEELRQRWEDEAAARRDTRDDRARGLGSRMRNISAGPSFGSAPFVAGSCLAEREFGAKCH
jgi:hypothetical protein